MLTSTRRIAFGKTLLVSGFSGLLVIAVTIVLTLGPPVLADDDGDNHGDDDRADVVLDGKECLDCHQQTFAGATKHRGVDDCEACHEQEEEDEHEFEFAIEKDEMCTQCHDLDLAGAIHEPVTKGDCTVCHEVHSADQPKLLNAPMFDLCASCHEDLRGKRKAHVHGPFGGGQCQGCHAAHASENESLLVAEGTDLCVRCHAEFKADPESSDTWHMPVQQDCSICHSPHESDTPRMLTAKAPELCTECHDEMGERIASGVSVHKALLTDQSCSGCHRPHRSEFGKLLKSPSKDLCLTCHDREYEQQGKRPMPDFKKLLDTLPQHHGPVKEKNCEGCHDAHAAATFRLLRKPYPEKFYDAYNRDNYALCFECHPDELVTEERSTATNFRDGDRNLHFVHVNRKKKGRTCRACHAVHASELPHHLRKTTPFGDWELPVGFAENADGGTCRSGCHTEKTYSRGIDD